MLVRDYLKRYRVTQPEFARLLGISLTHVSRLAIGTRASPELALKIETITRGEVSVIEAMYPKDPDFVERAKARRIRWWSSCDSREIETREGRAA